jgi:hypothetical protein
MKKHSAFLLFGLLAIATPQWSAAEQVIEIGDWKMHYVAFPSTFLKPQIANRYGLDRSRDIGVVNITVLDRDDMPAHATLDGTATNLLGQMLPLDFEEITDGSAIYYIATIRYTDQELIRFSIEVTPAGTTRPLQLKFRQKLYWDEK